MNEELFQRGFQILNDRNTWEEKQRRYYLMRHDGLRRRNKPFPTAADLHLPLIDEKVNQKKAFTMAQLFNSERLATFNSMRRQSHDISDSAADFFTYELRKRSNFIRVMQTVVDTMWLRGRGCVKAFVDPFNDYSLKFENVDPMFLLMPDDVDGFDESYEWVHVRQIPLALFKLDRRWCAEDRQGGDIPKETLSKVCGGKDAETRLSGQKGINFEQITEDKELREGYTHSDSSNTVIVWEHYIKTMGGYTVYYYCPLAMDVKLRQAHGVPFKIDGKVSSGFFSFQSEVKDEGWYAPRGVGEKVADKEIYGCKLWNSKADAMTFLNTPMMVSDTGVQNPGNYRMAPGEVLPPGVRPAVFGAPPYSFDQEISFVRGEAELSAQTPDLGIEKPNERSSEKRTAKEVGVAAGIAQISQSNETISFNYDLSKLFAHCWGMMMQFKRNKLTYFITDDLKTLPENALHGEYDIMAGGSAENWDRNLKVQKAGQRYQAFVGKPNINQDELASDLIAADDARLVKRLVIPSNQKVAGEVEDETQEIVSMMITHFPAPVKEEEDHATRAKTIVQFLVSQDVKAMPIDPLAKQRIMEHLAQHMQFLKKLSPEQYQQTAQQIQQMEQQAAQQAPRAPMRPPMMNRPPQRQTSSLRQL